MGDQLNEPNTLRANLPPPKPTRTLHSLRAAVVTSLRPGLSERSKYGAYFAERSVLTSSGDGVKGSVESRRMSEVKHDKTAVESGELLVCRRHSGVSSGWVVVLGARAAPCWRGPRQQRRPRNPGCA